MKPKSVSAAAKESAIQVFESLDNLSKRCSEWDTSLYQKANTALYTLLAEAYEIYEYRFLMANSGTRRELSEQLTQKLAEKNLRTNKRTTVLGMLLRYIFNNNRRRVSQYKKVLIVAKSRSVDPKSLADWITVSGGVEEVCAQKREVSAKTISDRETFNQIFEQIKADFKNIAAATPHAEISISGMNWNVQTIFFATPNGSGGLKIVKFLKKVEPKFLDSFIAAMAREQMAEQRTDVKYDNEANLFNQHGGLNQDYILDRKAA